MNKVGNYGIVAVVAALAWCVVGEIGGGTGGRGTGGWLARLVQFHKQAFFNDYEKYDNNLVDIQASVEPAETGYEDSPAWDESSVMRLLTLVSHSRDPSVKPVRKALRRVLRPTRRYIPYIPIGKDSHDLFPSMAKNVPNFIYDEYADESKSVETGSEERGHQRKHRTTAALGGTELERLEVEEAVLVVRNPVEARLPAARISVSLLRKIMEERAMAARAITPSSRRTRTWLPRYNATVAEKKASDATSPSPAPAPAPAGASPKATATGEGDATSAPAADGAAAADGKAADGKEADGKAADGKAADGKAAEGKAADEGAANDAATPAAATDAPPA